MSIGSFFGSIFSGAGTAIGGFFSTVKAYIIVAVVVLFLLMAGGFYWYYHWSQAQIQTLTTNQAQLQDALTTQLNNFNQLKKDTDSLVKSYQDLQSRENTVEQQNNELQKQIEQFDFNGNAIKNHDATEKTINTQTQKLFNDIQNLTDPKNTAIPGDQTTPPAKKKGK